MSEALFFAGPFGTLRSMAWRAHVPFSSIGFCVALSCSNAPSNGDSVLDASSRVDEDMSVAVDQGVGGADTGSQLPLVTCFTTERLQIPTACNDGFCSENGFNRFIVNVAFERREDGELLGSVATPPGPSSESFGSGVRVRLAADVVQGGTIEQDFTADAPDADGFYETGAQSPFFITEATADELEVDISIECVDASTEFREHCEDGCDTLVTAYHYFL